MSSGPVESQSQNLSGQSRFGSKVPKEGSSGKQTSIISWSDEHASGGDSVLDAFGEFDADDPLPVFWFPHPWTAEFDEPVVERAGACSKRMHLPDLDAPTPLPDCRAATRDPDGSWAAKERETVEGFRQKCAFCAWGEDDE